MLARMRRKGNPLALLVGMQTGAATLENSNDVDGARVYYAKPNKSVGERQIPYDFIHMWNLKNKARS